MRPQTIRLLTGLVCAAMSVFVAHTGLAQVSIPNIQNPINKARAAAEKTNQQIDATNKTGAGIDAKGATNGTGAAAAAQLSDQQKKGATAAQKGAPQSSAQKAPAAQARAGAKPGKGDTATVVSQAGARRGPQVTIMREVFTYTAGGRRDPFISLMASGELRPIFSDLVLTGVIFDSEGRRSVALLVDASTGESYRVREGQMLARMKVTKIGMQDITFSIDEFGLSRSETLIVDKTRKGPVAGRRP